MNIFLVMNYHKRTTPKILMILYNITNVIEMNNNIEIICPELISPNLSYRLLASIAIGDSQL